MCTMEDTEYIKLVSTKKAFNWCKLVFKRVDKSAKEKGILCFLLCEKDIV